MKKTSTKSEDTATVSCEQCCSEIPLSSENKDYVQYFCGIECYKKWSEKTSADISKKKVYVHQSEGLQTK
ncbi:MAG: DUF3330 domain-containing protein [Gammaproteobacteria bacterium]